MFVSVEYSKYSDPNINVSFELLIIITFIILKKTLISFLIVL
jgi:hypothetical protein